MKGLSPELTYLLRRVREIRGTVIGLAAWLRLDGSVGHGLGAGHFWGG